MAERLTEKYNDDFGITHARIKNSIKTKYYRSYKFLPLEQAMLKLGKLEDVMEKYGFDDISGLDFILGNIGRVAKDRDTWKKACELACDDLGLYEDITTTQIKMECYYQQAKERNG